MRKKIYMIALTVTLMLSGCGAGKTAETKAAQETTVAETTAAEETSETKSNLEAVGDVSVDKGVFDVTLNIPAEFVGGSTQEDLDKKAAEYGYKATLNDDGSATYEMTKSQHAEMMKSYADSINESLAKMIGSKDYPNITDITANDDFTSFTITTKNAEPDLSESMSVMQLYMMSGVYNIFNGTPVENVHVDFVNADSGQVISSTDSADSKK